MKRIAILATATLLTAAGARASDALPEGSVPLSADQLNAKLADKTLARGGHERVYLAPDGTTLGAYDNKAAEAVGKGTWKVDGNELCWSVDWRGRGGNHTERDCRKFYQTGSGIIVQQTVNADGSPLTVFPIGGFVLMPGDRATERQ